MTHKATIRNLLKRSTMLLPFLIAAMSAFIMVTAVPVVLAEEEPEIPFDEASIYFELNNTDGDLGIHALIDGDAWKYLEIEDPRERRILNVVVRGRLRKQGLTELFFESAEPSFDELPPAKFFRRFPEGYYEIEGITLEGEERESTVWLSHVMPAPPDGILVSETSIDPDSVDCDEGPIPVAAAPVVISWEPVKESHPEIGKSGDIEVEKYQLVVEEEEAGIVLSVDLPPSVTELEIPSGIIDLGEQFKFEILVRATNGNQTAVESCFVVDNDSE